MFHLNWFLEGNLRISAREKSDNEFLFIFLKCFLLFLPMLVSVSLVSSGLGHLLVSHRRKEYIVISVLRLRKHVNNKTFGW